MYIEQQTFCYSWIDIYTFFSLEIFHAGDGARCTAQFENSLSSIVYVATHAIK